MKPNCDSKDRSIFSILPWALMQGIVCACLLLAWGGGEKAAYAEEPSRHHIFVLVDESGSIRGYGSHDPHDPDNRRTRFTRFLVQYLQAFYPQEAEIGVIGFISSPVTITHLMPVEQWAHADLQSLERRLAQSTSQEQEVDTRFIPVLQTARDFLQKRCPEESSDDVCQIVVFTDGLWETASTKEDGGAISRTLQTLYQKSISVTVVLLAGDPISTTQYAKDDYFRVWNAGSTGVISNATTMSATEVYSEVLQGLGLSEPLERLAIREFTGTAVIAEQVSPFQRYTRLFFLADNPVAETWTPAPDVQVGVNRLWFDPPAGDIRGRLEANGETTQTTLVYYEVSSKTYPIGFEARIMPDRVALGQATILDGWFTAGGQTIPNTAGFSVQATVDGAPMSFSQQPDGHFTRMLSTTVPGEHKVVFQPTVPEFVRADAVGDLSRTFYVEALPRLHLRVETPKQVSTSTIPLSITVTVENAASSRDELTPTVMLVEQQRTLSLNHVGCGEFVTVTEVVSGTKHTVRAHLGDGWTKQGLYFDVQEDEQEVPIPGPYKVSEPPPSLNQVIQTIVKRFPILLAPGLLLLLLCIAIIVRGWLREKARRDLNKAKQNVTKLVKEAQKGKIGPKAQEKMSTAIQTMGKAHPQLDSMKDEIQECGQLVSLAYRVEASGGEEDDTAESEYAVGVKNDLVQQAKNDGNIVALAMLLRGLLDACFPRSSGAKRLLPLQALYKHIFSFGSDLAATMLDGNSDAGTPRISKQFVEVFEFVVPLAPSEPNQENRSVREVWEAFRGLTSFLHRLQSLHRGQREDPKNYLQEILGEEGLARFLETVREASGDNSQDFNYLNCVFGALQNLARDVANGNAFRNYEILDEAIENLGPNSEPEGCHKKNMKKAFKELETHSVQDFSHLQLVWRAGKNGYGRYKFPQDQSFSELGMGIPEFLIFGQIQRFT